jgi:alkyldihydroxyacetonephosphate synthase
VDLQTLVEKLPPGSVSTEFAELLAVSTDLWPRHMIRWAEGQLPNLPLAVVWPTSTKDVQTLVDFARAHDLRLIAYGAGSNVVGGATPAATDIVVDFKRMARVLQINLNERYASAQVGILGEIWERKLNRQGATQGHFPSSIYCSTLGGWIAGRGAGQMSSRFGKIEDQVLGGILVLGDGRMIEQKPSPLGGSQLAEFIGCEGQLALWIQADVRIRPLAQLRWWRGFDFPDLHAALLFAQHVLEAGVVPSVLRIYDPIDSFLHRQTHGEQLPHDRGPSRLAGWGARFPKPFSRVGNIFGGACRCIVGLEGNTQALLDWEAQEVLHLALGAKDLGSAPGENWYKRRYAISYRQSNVYRAGVAADTMEVASCWDNVLPVYHAVREAALDHGAMVLAHFSHAYLEGMALYFTYAIPLKLGEEGYFALWQACLEAAVAAGSNVSHHHGTGQLKAAALQAFRGGSQKVFVEMQRANDPDNVLGVASTSCEPGTPKNRFHCYNNYVMASPNDKLCDIEAQLNTQKKTLGPLPYDTIASEAGAFRRFNPQFHILEPLVAGVDSDGMTFVPVPRSAQGPELTPRLIQSATRIWLRTQAAYAEPIGYLGKTIDVIEAAKSLAHDDVGAAVIQQLDIQGEQANWILRYPKQLGRMELLKKVIAASFKNSPEILKNFVELGPVPGNQTATKSWLWSELRQHCEQNPQTQLFLYAMDAAGVVGTETQHV